MGTKPGSQLGKDKTEKACKLEARNEKRKIMHTEMWADSSSLVKASQGQTMLSGCGTERDPDSRG